MANHSATKKAIRQIERKTLVNKSKKSKIKTFVKKVLTEIQNGDQTKAREALRLAQLEIMQGVKKNLIKLNAGSRKISRLNKKIKDMNIEIPVVTLSKTTSKKIVAPIKKAAVKSNNVSDSVEKKAE